MRLDYEDALIVTLYLFKSLSESLFEKKEVHWIIISYKILFLKKQLNHDVKNRYTDFLEIDIELQAL